MQVIARKLNSCEKSRAIERSDEEMDAFRAGDFEIDIEIQPRRGQSLLDRAIVVISNGGALIAINQELRENQIFLAENFLDLSEGDVRAFLAGRPEWRSSGQ